LRYCFDSCLRMFHKGYSPIWLEFSAAIRLKPAKIRASAVMGKPRFSNASRSPRPNRCAPAWRIRCLPWVSGYRGRC